MGTLPTTESSVICAIRYRSRDGKALRVWQLEEVEQSVRRHLKASGYDVPVGAQPQGGIGGAGYNVIEVLFRLTGIVNPQAIEQAARAVPLATVLVDYVRVDYR